ncbi:MAG: hypothetical protein IJY12_03720 [Clostridia bacterium]|nr:hypothetical protein [Clostridia bacterium]
MKVFASLFQKASAGVGRRIPRNGISFLQSFFFVPTVTKKKASNTYCNHNGCPLFLRLGCAKAVLFTLINHKNKKVITTPKIAACDDFLSIFSFVFQTFAVRIFYSPFTF